MTQSLDLADPPDALARRPAVGEPPLWGAAETAAYLGIPVGTLYQWISRHQGPRSYKIGKHRRWRPAEVFAWLDTRASPPEGRAS